MCIRDRTDVAGSANATETDLNKGAEGSLPEQTVTVDQIANANPTPAPADSTADGRDVYKRQLLGLPMWVVGGTIAPFCLALPQLMLALLAAGMGITGLAVGTALAGAVTNVGLSLIHI